MPDPKHPATTLPASALPPGGSKWALSNQTAGPLLQQIGVAQPPPPPVLPTAPAEKSFFAGLLQSARSYISPEVDRSLTSMFTDAAKMFYYTTYFDFGKAGDQQFSQDVAAKLEGYLDKDGKPKEFGKYDIMMAAGWKPEGPIKVNGVMKTLDKPIDNMLAVFVRNKDGSVEILDPSIKVTSFKEMPRVLDAITPFSVRSAIPASPFLDPAYKKMALTNTPSDDRWRETAGTFVAVQLATMVATGGAWAVGKGGTALATKVPQLERVVGATTALSKGVQAGAAPLVASTTATGISSMGGTMSQNLYFSPAAIEKIANGIANAITHPNITAESMRKNLNTALHEHTFDQGNDAKQLYVASLKGSERPWTRLQEACEGLVSAYQKPNHPWQAWPNSPKQLEVGEIRDALSKHTGVNAAFFASAQKILAGKPLTDQELFVARIGYKLGPGAPADMDPVGKKTGESGFNFTDQEKQDTARLVSKQMHLRLGTLIFADRTPEDVQKSAALMKKYGIDPGLLKQANDDPSIILNHKFTPAQITAFVNDQAQEFGTVVEQQKKFEAAKAQGRVMALGMGL